MFNTIRARLTLWYASVLTGVLVAFSLGVYLLLSQALHLRVDANLQSIIRHRAHLADTRRRRGTDPRRRRPHDRRRSSQAPQQALAIFDAGGTLLARGGWDDFKPRLPASANETFQVYTVPEDDDDDEHLRVATSAC